MGFLHADEAFAYFHEKVLGIRLRPLASLYGVGEEEGAFPRLATPPKRVLGWFQGEGVTPMHGALAEICADRAGAEDWVKSLRRIMTEVAEGARPDYDDRRSRALAEAALAALAEAPASGRALLAYLEAQAERVDAHFADPLPPARGR